MGERKHKTTSAGTSEGQPGGDTGLPVGSFFWDVGADVSLCHRVDASGTPNMPHCKKKLSDEILEPTTLMNFKEPYKTNGCSTKQRNEVRSSSINFAMKLCLVCFSHCAAVLNYVRTTHGLPADRAPVYRGCPDRDPLGCPLIPRQDGIRDKAPTLWLLLQLLRLLHACARDQHTLDKLSQTHPLGQMYVDVDFDRFGLFCDAPHISNLNL